ncbi:hypothetical protein V6N11_031440 [Hibiscus sabdariffa]|uniref:Uncharacterized protein n=1 Tax=Hibiscus sabdariffa TaxID=183260 RepID=A0ABR2SXY7_9ROSI
MTAPFPSKLVLGQHQIQHSDLQENHQCGFSPRIVLGSIPPSASYDSQHNAEFQFSTEGSSFGALLDTQGDGLFDARTESDGINNGLISNQLSTERSSFEAFLDGQEDSRQPHSRWTQTLMFDARGVLYVKKLCRFILLMFGFAS